MLQMPAQSFAILEGRDDGFPTPKLLFLKMIHRGPKTTFQAS